jgi:hypothetical protein
MQTCAPALSGNHKILLQTPVCVPPLPRSLPRSLWLLLRSLLRPLLRLLLRSLPRSLWLPRSLCVVLCCGVMCNHLRPLHDYAIASFAAFGRKCTDQEGS